MKNLISLFLENSLYIQITMLFIFFYFYQRKKNVESNVEPRIQIFDKIFFKYYKLYFYKFKGAGHYPGLIHIYNAMAIECQKQEIDCDTIKRVNKSKNSKKNNTFFTFISGSLVFFGLTNFGNLIEHLRNLLSLINGENSSDPWKNLLDFFNKNSESIGLITYIVSLLLIILIFITLTIFFIRMDKDSNVIKYSKESQMGTIVEDFSRYYENQFNYNTNCENFQLEDKNIPLFKIGVTRLKNEIALHIPASLSGTQESQNSCFKDENKVGEVVLTWKNENKYKFNFKKIDSWTLIKVEDMEGNSISEEELKNLKILFEILFEGANIYYSNNGLFLSTITSIVNYINKIQNNWVKYPLIGLFVLMLLVLSLVVIFVLCLLIRIHMLYVIFLIYACISISSWLLKNVNGL